MWMAARTSPSDSALSTASGSMTSPTTRSILPTARRCPSLRSSRMMTRSPRERSRLTMNEPIYPAPPVTSTSISDPLATFPARPEIGARQAPDAKAGERDERKIVEPREEEIAGSEKEERTRLMIEQDGRHEEGGAEEPDERRADDVAEVASRVEHGHHVEVGEPEEEDAAEAKIDLLIGHRKTEQAGERLGRDEDG